VPYADVARSVSAVRPSDGKRDAAGPRAGLHARELLKENFIYPFTFCNPQNVGILIIILT
jgi:hypothetical protein